MSVKDVIKSSVFEKLGAGTGLSIYEIIIILVVACLIGIYVFFVYKTFTHSEFYSKDFNITLIGMTIVVAAIMIAMQSNLLVSLGMVGALSIVRFRTAVKSPLDLLYLFWSISAGIICGVGLYILAIVLCLIMTLALWLFGRIKTNRTPGLLVVRMSVEAISEDVEDTVYDFGKSVCLKSTSVKGRTKEVIYQVDATDYNKLVEEISKIDGVASANYLEHDGEFRG